MEQFWITLLSIGAGAIGYLIVTFWVQPIIRYREIKYRIAADMVFFANAIDVEKTNGSLNKNTLKRQESNRRCAADLSTIYYALPCWYRKWRAKLNENPIEASKNLIGLSNSSTWWEAENFIKGVKNNLRLILKDI